MSPAALPLPSLQRWMQEVVVHPGETAEAVASARAQAALKGRAIGDVILPSRSGLTPAERVGIYQGMYLLRMEEALSSDYEGLKHFLGDEGFFRLVRDYVQEHPSVTYTLNRLSDDLPEFVARWRGTRARAFLADLARLELAVAQAFDAEETEPIGEPDIASIAEKEWPKVRLSPIAAFRLLRFRHRVAEYLDSIREGDHSHPPLTRKDTYVVVYRRDYAVRRQELSRAAHDLLADLAAGKPLGKAVAAALARSGRPRPSAEVLFRWFREWTTAGLFRSIRVR